MTTTVRHLRPKPVQHAKSAPSAIAAKGALLCCPRWGRSVRRCRRQARPGLQAAAGSAARRRRAWLAWPTTRPRKVSSRLRHVSSSGLYQGLLRGLVDPRDGGQFRWLWSAVPEALGVGGVGRVQGLLPLGADLGRGAEVH